MQIVKRPICSLVNSFLLVLFSTLIVQAEKKQGAETTIYQGGIRNCTDEGGFRKKELQQLIRALQIKTGFQSLAFDAQGFLTIAEPENIRGGSATARRLLQAALASPRQFHLAQKNNNVNISFSRLAPGIHYRNMSLGTSIEIVPVLFDFADFGHLLGDDDVLQSFDIGMIFLHELVHGVHGLPDVSIESDEIGECEQFMNAIRRELNLPERDRYVARTIAAGYEFDRPLYVAQLPFIRYVNKKGTTAMQTVMLQWKANRVGVIQGKPDRTLVANKNKDPKQASASIH